MDETHENKGAYPGWAIILLLLLIILGQGAFSYFVVGDQGQPGWEYRPVADLPGESPFAIYTPLAFPQHVKGAKGE